MGKITRHLTRRRDLLRSLSACTAAALVPSFSTSATANVSKLPFKVVETTLGEALQMQRELRSANTYPLIVGSGDRLDRLRENTELMRGEFNETAGEIVQNANHLEHPRDLFRLRSAEFEEICKPTECETDVLEEPDSWPSEPIPPESAQTLLPILFTPIFFDKGSILEVPTDDWTTVPAHLFWGGWHANPDPAYHIAAWRSWRDRYGARLIGLTLDTLIFSVERRPADRSEAFQLATEMYEYCPDIVEQGVGNVTNLASGLMVSNAWFFWWD